MATGVAVALAAVGSVKLYMSVTGEERPIIARIETPKVLPVAARDGVDENDGPQDEVAAAADDEIDVPQVPAGESFDGVNLPEDDARLTDNATELSVRRGCVWGTPGRTPYKGTVRQALVAARVPEEVVHKIDLMVERRMISDRLMITRDSIQTTNGKRRFEPNIVAMGFGKTLCFGTRVNFAPGHVELADLYEASDAAGTKFSVMVPYVCRNVSVLAARAERGNGRTNGFGTAPEPGTLASVIAALAALAISGRLGRRVRHDGGTRR
ncbi:MAG: hypothetical protein ACM3PU_15240 [Gemmatimonadota bacterium]